MMGGHDEARAVMMVMLALLVAVACTSKPNPSSGPSSTGEGSPTQLGWQPQDSNPGNRRERVLP